MYSKSHAIVFQSALLIVTCTTAAQAWDPNENIPNVYQPQATSANSAVRYPIGNVQPAYRPIVFAPMPSAVDPQPIESIAYTPPAPVEAAAPAPVEYAAPSTDYLPAQQAVAYNDYAAMPDTYTPFETAPAPKRYGNRMKFGVEAFYDNYKEPDTFPDLTNNAYYGSIEAAFEHDFSESFYGTLEQRVSYGVNNYKSNQGHIEDVPQWEFETRLMSGVTLPIGSTRLKTYAGLGARYFIDESKGEVTTGGAGGYDRRIFQLYAPVGMTYEFPAFGIHFAPNVEVDPIFYGNVQSRLGNLGGGNQNFTNRQNSGYGVRGEFMMGQEYADGRGWEMGPFVRYWNVPDSDIDSNASGSAIEPKNERFQTGLKLRGKF